MPYMDPHLPSNIHQMLASIYHTWILWDIRWTTSSSFRGFFGSPAHLFLDQLTMSPMSPMSPVAWTVDVRNKHRSRKVTQKGPQPPWSSHPQWDIHGWGTWWRAVPSIAWLDFSWGLPVGTPRLWGYGAVPKWGVPLYRWRVYLEHPTKMDDDELGGTPIWGNPHISSMNMTKHHRYGGICYNVWKTEGSTLSQRSETRLSWQGQQFTQLGASGKLLDFAKMKMAMSIAMSIAMSMPCWFSHEKWWFWWSSMSFFVGEQPEWFTIIWLLVWTPLKTMNVNWDD